MKPMKSYQLAMALGALLTVPNFAAEKAATPTTETKIEQAIHDYIMAHPEVVLESVRAYDARAKQAQLQSARDKVQANLKELHSNSPVAGDTKDANAVTVVEFFDYRCGYCKKMEGTVGELAKSRGVRVVYKDLPILGPESLLAAQAALAADKQGAYQAIHKRLMELREITASAIDQVAVELKLDVAQLKKDMASPEVAARLEKNQELAQKLGVNATPTFVIGNDVAPGALDAKAFQSAIEAARGASQTAHAH
jgi:protein-disulfide isomerase